jgi:hypothetical protein
VPGAYFPAVTQALTPTRLTGYRVNPAESDIEVLSRYVWNLALGASLYPSLSLLEVALRNRLDSAIAARDGPNWFDDVLVVVEQGGQDAVVEAKGRLVKELKVLSPGGVISTLDFGFWTSLFHTAYEQGGGGALGRKPLWPALLPAVAPGRTRKQLSGRLNDLRKLRNRMFHYEPIWRGMVGKSLLQLHSELMETIDWLDVSIGRTAVLLDDFPRVHAAGIGWFGARLQLLDL